MSSRESKKTTKSFQVSREEFFKATPLRHPSLRWEKDAKGVRVIVPRKRTLWFRVFSRFLPLAKERGVLLDEQGEYVWSLCDGEHRIKEIARMLSEKYNMRVSDAAAALDLYLVHLSSRGLVGFSLPESAHKRYHKRFGNKTRRETEDNRR